LGSLFVRNIAEESYRDIRNSPELSAMIAMLATRSGYTGETIRLTHVPGVETNQLQIAGDGEVLSCADLVARIDEVNIEIVLSTFAKGVDIHVSEGAEKILRRKLAKEFVGGCERLTWTMHANSNACTSDHFKELAWTRFRFGCSALHSRRFSALSERYQACWLRALTVSLFPDFSADSAQS
jgi:hypothetical protein